MPFLDCREGKGEGEEWLLHRRTGRARELHRHLSQGVKNELEGGGVGGGRFGGRVVGNVLVTNPLLRGRVGLVLVHCAVI